MAVPKMSDYLFTRTYTRPEIGRTVAAGDSRSLGVISALGAGTIAWSRYASVDWASGQSSTEHLSDLVDFDSYLEALEREVDGLKDKRARARLKLGR